MSNLVRRSVASPDDCPAAFAPKNISLSVPAPPSIVSLPSPGSHWNTSSPAPNGAVAVVAAVAVDEVARTGDARGRGGVRRAAGGGAGGAIAAAGGFAACFVIRALALHYGWSLPVYGAREGRTMEEVEKTGEGATELGRDPAELALYPDVLTSNQYVRVGSAGHLQ